MEKLVEFGWFDMDWPHRNMLLHTINMVYMAADDKEVTALFMTSWKLEVFNHETPIDRIEFQFIVIGTASSWY